MDIGHGHSRCATRRRMTRRLTGLGAVSVSGSWGATHSGRPVPGRWRAPSPCSRCGRRSRTPRTPHPAESAPPAEVQSRTVRGTHGSHTTPCRVSPTCGGTVPDRQRDTRLTHTHALPSQPHLRADSAGRRPRTHNGYSSCPDPRVGN